MRRKYLLPILIITLVTAISVIGCNAVANAWGGPHHNNSENCPYLTIQNTTDTNITANPQNPTSINPDCPYYEANQTTNQPYQHSSEGEYHQGRGQHAGRGYHRNAEHRQGNADCPYYNM